MNQERIIDNVNLSQKQVNKEEIADHVNLIENKLNQRINNP
jgi:hypothetical protein